MSRQHPHTDHANGTVHRAAASGRDEQQTSSSPTAHQRTTGTGSGASAMSPGIALSWEIADS